MIQAMIPPTIIERFTRKLIKRPLPRLSRL
jgi:hypothetical protein